MNKTAIATVLLTYAFIGTSAAAELPKAGDLVVGAQVSYGNISHDNFNSDEDGVGQLMFFADYYFKPGWAMELGVNSGTNVQDWICENAEADDEYCLESDDSISPESDLDFSNLILAVRFDKQVSANSFVYGKLGVQYFDYEMSTSDNVFEEDDGTGIYSELGWRYEWSNQIGINVGYQFVGMGDLETSSLAVGVGYKF